MTTRRKIETRISAKVKSICALFWRKLAPRGWQGKISAWCPNTCGPICNLLVSAGSRFRNGKSAME